MEHTVESWDFGGSPWSLGHHHVKLSMKRRACIPMSKLGQPSGPCPLDFKLCADPMWNTRLVLIWPWRSGFISIQSLLSTLPKPYPTPVFMISHPWAPVHGTPSVLPCDSSIYTTHTHTLSLSLSLSQLPNSYSTKTLLPSDWYLAWMLRAIATWASPTQHLLTCIIIACLLFYLLC